MYHLREGGGERDSGSEEFSQTSAAVPSESQAPPLESVCLSHHLVQQLQHIHSASTVYTDTFHSVGQV